jgi:hypothetical protein
MVRRHSVSTCGRELPWSLLVQARDITYNLPRAAGLGLDSREYFYLLGVVCEATAQTTGSVRIGRVDKEFADPLAPIFSRLSWKWRYARPPERTGIST